MATNGKTRIDVIQANSLRELVDVVNSINVNAGKHHEGMIEKDDIVSLLKDNDTFLLVYYC